MRPHRPLRAALLTTAAAALLAGCGDAGELRSAGPTPTAAGPVRLWPDLPPVTAPPYDYGETDTALIPGVTVPGSGVRGLDPVAVVRAEAAAFPTAYAGLDGSVRETVPGLDECARTPGRCPVLKPYYRDLTGDGREELIVGIRMPRQQTEVRCYMPGEGKNRGKLIRIMSASDQLVRVEVAGRDVVLRSVSAAIPGYEYRTAWSWDARHQVMLPARDEIVRVEPRSGTSRDGGPAAHRTGAVREEQ
ncbi:hypothetical protein ACIBCM_12165 [Streptomyces sp. NPDC051018]|uniref:hypothetical protein n=1 Tax=Streptomyces sp. NPDC051018 TaxID=3365639 RepID=UPI0037ACF632